MSYTLGRPPGAGFYFVAGLLDGIEVPILVEVDDALSMSIPGVLGRVPFPIDKYWAGPITPPAMSHARRYVRLDFGRPNLLRNA